MLGSLDLIRKMPDHPIDDPICERLLTIQKFVYRFDFFGIRTYYYICGYALTNSANEGFCNFSGVTHLNKQRKNFGIKEKEH